MRDLALKVTTGGVDVAFDILGAQSRSRVVPFACELVGVVYDISATPTNAHTADILVNGSEMSTVTDIDFPATTTQGFATPDGRVFLQAGDRVNLKSNGENATPDAYDITLAWIFRPLSTRPVGEIWLDGESFTDIDTAAASISKCIPIACELTEVAIASLAATDAQMLLSIFTDNADSTIDIVLPTATTNAVIKPTSRLFCKTGGMISLSSDGVSSTGGFTAVTYVLRPESNEIPAGWIYSGFYGGRAFHTPTTEFEAIVAPCHGKVRNLVTHWPQPINTTPNTGATFDLLVNGSTPTGTPIYRNTEDTRDEMGLSVPIENQHDVFVRQGDLITIEINGEQAATTANSLAGIWIEPMGQAAGGGI
jgi:hypothetical protein